LIEVTTIKMQNNVAVLFVFRNSWLWLSTEHRYWYT